MTKICTYKSCTKPQRTKKLCHNHYNKLWRGTLGWGEKFRAKDSPTIKDLMWTAGFLEGEGCFKTNATKYRTEVVMATQVNKEPLENLLKWFGGTLALRKQRKANHSDYWEWRVSGARARGLMMTLYILMSEHKRQQIKSSFRHLIHPNLKYKSTLN